MSLIHMPFGQRSPMPVAKKPHGFADGGMPQSMADPWFEKREASNIAAYHPGGLYGGNTGGRTDNIANLVPAGAYVVPADVVSGLGEGNSQAGAAIMDKMFHSNPHGIESDKMTHGRGAGMPAPPRPFHQSEEFAKGGTIKGHVPIIAASGEFLIRPDALIRKFGSLERAHKVMDNFVQHYRKKTAKKMLSLPGPKT